jgi:hypothetical protein
VDKNAPVRIVKIPPEVNNDNFNSIFISFKFIIQTVSVTNALKFLIENI